MAGEDKMKLAKDIIEHPEKMDDYKGQYVIIGDQCLTFPQFDKLNLAICIMAKRGWRAMNLTVTNTTVGMQATMAYVLMEKTT